MSGLRARQGGWGFKLDYDKEIKADEKLIAALSRLIENRWFHPTTMRDKDGVDRDVSNYFIGLCDLAFMDVNGTAARFDLRLVDLADLAHSLDREPSCAQLDGSVVELPDTAYGAYKRGKEIADRLVALWEGDLYTEAQAIKVLKKAKTDLARHKRNKVKYGGRS